MVSFTSFKTSSPSSSSFTAESKRSGCILFTFISVFCWSGGSGGGTGTYGRIPTMDADGNLGDDDYKFYYGRGPWTRDWNALVAMNSGTDSVVYVDVISRY